MDVEVVERETNLAAGEDEMKRPLVDQRIVH